MGTVWTVSLARMYGVMTDELEKAIRECPDELWEESLWEVRKSDPYVWPVRRVDGSDEGEHLLQVYSAFWNVAYHTLFFFDCYLEGGGEGCVPPPPFRAEDQGENVIPDRSYTKDELLSYVEHCRSKAQATMDSLTPEQALRPAGRRGRPFADLLMHNLLHVREHSAQMSMFLGQRRT